MSDLSDPMDCSLPGSSVHGIFQAKVLEWGAIAFSENLKLDWPNFKALAFSSSEGEMDRNAKETGLCPSPGAR